MRQSKTRKMAEKKGFTLIELLVVISIIALLLSVMMPALNRARIAGRATVCAANFRQIGLATYLYAQDYNNHIVPATFNRPDQNAQFWYNVLRRYISEQGDYAGDTAEVFLCPGDRTEGGLRSKGAFPHGVPDLERFNWQRRSYGINGQTQELVQGHVIGKRIESVRVPSELALATETQAVWFLQSNFSYPHRWIPSTLNVQWWLDAIPGSPTQAVQDTPVDNVQWHGVHVNMVFVDGHVEKFDAQTLYPEQDNEKVWHESGVEPFINF